MAHGAFGTCGITSHGHHGSQVVTVAEVGLDDRAVGGGKLPARGRRDARAVAVRCALVGNGLAGGGEPAPSAHAVHCRRLASGCMEMVLAVIGAFGLGSVVTLGVQWSIEKRRDDRSHRRELLKTWRAGISAYESREDQTISLTRRMPFLASEWYATLRPHLTDEARRRLESRTVMITAGGRDGYVMTMHREVDRLEREWKLA